MYLFVSCIYLILHFFSSSSFILFFLHFLRVGHFSVLVLQVKFSIWCRCRDCSKPARERQDMSELGSGERDEHGEMCLPDSLMSERGKPVRIRETEAQKEKVKWSDKVGYGCLSFLFYTLTSSLRSKVLSLNASPILQTIKAWNLKSCSKLKSIFIFIKAQTILFPSHVMVFIPNPSTLSMEANRKKVILDWLVFFSRNTANTTSCYGEIISNKEQ